MTKQKRSLLWIILIIFASLGSFGFSGSSHPALHQGNIGQPVGWIEITVAADALMYDGANSAEMSWYPVKGMTRVYKVLTSGTWEPEIITLYTVLKSDGVFGGGMGSLEMFWPVKLDIISFLYEDCSMDFFIDIVNYPGMSVACAPIVGCFPDTLPGQSYEGPIINMPAGETMARVSWNPIPNTTGEFWIFINSLSAGDKCQESQNLP